ncbi:MAG: hypothetical protein Q4P36_03475 [Bowdeniella nasicola]|nr:hypothetical protein [Bowdeniella nasicola]
MSGEDTPSPTPGPPPPEGGAAKEPSQPSAPSFSERLYRLWTVTKDLLSVKNVVLALMVLVIVVVGLTRGWDTALAEVENEASHTALGEEFAAGPFTLTVNDATIDDDCLDAFGDYPQCLRVIFTATNTSDRAIEDSAFATHLLDSGMLSLEEDGERIPTALPHPRIERALDGLTQGAYQPGIPGDYTAIWAVPAATQTCDVNLIVRDATWVKSALDGHHYWRVDDPLTVITLCGEKSWQNR